ncbi:MAG: aminodeoxychorismate/anthranilate synthase component II [Chlorobiales bacterium]|jgi:anthranilate synthase component II|nr:aminodeoxychorismate/anthranilate synthase component II [Chlorobiales bacterium]
MILVLDNYDSFTYNLVQYLGELGADVEVFRNDTITLDEISEKSPEKILISPGPGTPKEAGISISLIREFQGKIPIFGVCLGHQAIGEALGGKVIRAKQLMHGKTSLINHDGQGIYAGVQNPFVATRYHSLIIERESIPKALRVNAWTEDDVIMGVECKEKMLFGVQYHPESIMTTEGKKILKNFLEL